MLLNPALVRFGRAHAIGTLTTVPLPGTPSTAGTAVAAKAVSYVCVTEDGYDHAAVLGRLQGEARQVTPVHQVTRMREWEVPKRFSGNTPIFLSASREHAW